MEVSKERQCWKAVLDGDKLPHACPITLSHSLTSADPVVSTHGGA